MKPVDSISSNLGIEVPIYFDGNHNFYYLLCTGVMQKSDCQCTCKARVTIAVRCVSVCPFSLFCLVLLGVQREV